MFRIVKTLSVFFMAALPIAAIAHKENKHLRAGNEYFAKGDFENAEAEYRSAAELAPGSFKANFNLADALYMQEQYDEAIVNFNIVSNLTQDNEVLAKTQFNIGNCYLKLGDYKKAEEAFKQSLRLYPKDVEAKYNLAYAKDKQNKEQPQCDNPQDKDKDSKQDQDKDKDSKQDQDKDKDSKQDQDKDKGGKQDEDKDKGGKQDKDEQNQNEQEPQQHRISKDNAQRMLDAAEQNDKETLEKVNAEKARGKKVKVEKDW
jgi:Ca-activated chloride channel homolog